MSDRAEEVAADALATIQKWSTNAITDAEYLAQLLRAYAEEAVRVWRGDLWLAHGHAGLVYGDDGEMACSACGVDYKREPNSSRVVAAALHARAEEAAVHWKQEADTGAMMLSAIHAGLGLTADHKGGISAQDVLDRVARMVEEARRENSELLALVGRLADNTLDWPKALWFQGDLSRADAIRLGEVLTAIRARGEGKG